MSRCDPHTNLIRGSLVCSSSNQHEHDLEASRPGCTVNYCQAMLSQEDRRKEHMIRITKSQVNSQLLKIKKQEENFIYSKDDISFLWGKQINGAGTSDSP